MKAHYSHLKRYLIQSLHRRGSFDRLPFPSFVYLHNPVLRAYRASSAIMAQCMYSGSSPPRAVAMALLSMV